VTAVEENAQAVGDAAASQRLNGIASDRVRFVCARVEDALRRFARERFDAAVLDPPRQGCSPEVIDGVCRTVAPPRVVYVSCNPEALAGELPVILRAGYRIRRVQPVDMFPHTPHVETVVTLTRPRRAKN
jgi:23S rRNA (uracil1939-C5)-methyltransferase